jgi:hypothetical protein
VLVLGARCRWWVHGGAGVRRRGCVVVLSARRRAGRSSLWVCGGAGRSSPWVCAGARRSSPLVHDGGGSSSPFVGGGCGPSSPLTRLE